jgi:hypothetical protein
LGLASYTLVLRIRPNSALRLAFRPLSPAHSGPHPPAQGIWSRALGLPIERPKSLTMAMLEQLAQQHGGQGEGHHGRAVAA